MLLICALFFLLDIGICVYKFLSKHCFWCIPHFGMLCLHFHSSQGILNFYCDLKVCLIHVSKFPIFLLLVSNSIPCSQKTYLHNFTPLKFTEVYFMVYSMIYPEDISYAFETNVHSVLAE